MVSKAEQELQSGLYSGWVQHRRFSPRSHEFRMPVFMVYLDLDEQDQVFGLTRWWQQSVKQRWNFWAPALFCREDYLDPSIPSLKTAVKNKVEAELGFRPSGAVRMLTNLRYFGFLINPITCYYCLDDSDRLAAMVLEVTNTPWGERHTYVLKCEPDQTMQRITFDKAMHVSPFHPMNIEYHWQANLPNQKLKLHLENWSKDETHNNPKLFDASVWLKREAISAAGLRRVLIRYPVMTLKVAGSIYWHALKLWVKKVPFYSHPKTNTRKLTTDNRNPVL